MKKHHDMKADSRHGASEHDGNFWNHILILSVLGLIITLISLIFDKPFLRFTVSIENGLLIKIFSLITLIGEVKYFVGILIIISAILFLKRKTLLSMWLAVASSGAIGYILKIIVARPRPFVYLNVISMVQTSLDSFPSGHALAVFCVLPFLNRYFPRYKALFWTVALLVALSRIYLQVHYLSDVFAGAFIGYIIGMIFLKLGEKYKWKL